MVENFRQFMGRGRRGFGWPQFAAHAAIKRPEIAGARAETLAAMRKARLARFWTRRLPVDEHFAATDLIIGTEAQPGGKMFVCRPFMHIEAHLGEDDMDRWGL